MDKLFIIFICVVIMAFAIIPLLTVKNIDKTDDSEQGFGKRVRSAKRKKNGDSVNAKVTPVRVVSGASGDETFDHIGIIEFDTEYGSDKSIVVDEDIDSYIVTGSLNGVSVNGFDYSNSKDNVFHNCRVVKKSAVKSFYKDYTEIKYFYKDRPVQYVERDGKPTIEVYDGPVAYLKEFSVARHGGNGKDYKVYYKNIDPDDPEFRKETEHYHEDLTVDTYGLVPGMGRKEYEDILIRYLIDRITKYGSQDAVRRLVLGIYGYRFPDDGLFTDIEAVFEKVIPLRYRQLEENSVSRGNFRRDLLSAIISGYRTVGCKYGYTLVDGDRMVEPSSECTAVAMTGVIPIMMVLLVVFVPIINGIPYMMFLTKVKKFGMITIMNVILGAFMWLTGMSYYALVVGTVSGLAAEFIYRFGDYKSKKLGIITYAVSGIYLWANYFGIFFNADAYFSTRQNFGQDYIDAVTKLLPIWMCPVLLAVDIVCCMIGGWLGTKALKKHFEKAGIA